MNKITTITRITSKVLDKYRNSIPRRAFIDAMEQVVAEAITSGEKQLGAPVPGIEILKRPDATAGELADLISGACPPFPTASARCTATSRAAAPAGWPGSLRASRPAARRWRTDGCIHEKDRDPPRLHQ